MVRAARAPTSSDVGPKSPDLLRREFSRGAKILEGSRSGPPVPLAGAIALAVLAFLGRAGGGAEHAPDGATSPRGPGGPAPDPASVEERQPYDEVYAIPRQLDFHPDGGISERPIAELIDALHALPPIDPLAGAATLSGRWQIHPDRTGARSLGPSGTLLLKEAPADLYLEAEVTLSRTDMEVSFLLRADAGLTRGYKLTLQPGDGLITLRPFSCWDRDRLLVARPAVLPEKRPIAVRIFLSGTVVEAFVDDRHALSSRVYRYPDGAVALDVVDGTALFDHILVRPLAGDRRPAEADR